MLTWSSNQWRSLVRAASARFLFRQAIMRVTPSYVTGPLWFSFMSEAIFCGKASGGFGWQSWKSSRWQIPNPTPLRKSSKVNCGTFFFWKFGNCSPIRTCYNDDWRRRSQHCQRVMSFMHLDVLWFELALSQPVVPLSSGPKGRLLFIPPWLVQAAQSLGRLPLVVIVLI